MKMKIDHCHLLLSVILVLTVFLFFGGPGYYAPRSLKSSWNLGHILYFSLLVYWISLYLDKFFKRFFIQCLLILAFTVLWGGAVELIQAHVHRTSDIGDVGRDIIGAMVGLFFILSTRKTFRKISLRGWQIVTICLVALQIYPVLVDLVDEYFAAHQFPVLSHFEIPSELQRWTPRDKIALDNTIHSSGHFSMRVQLNTEKYSGVNLKYFPGNWQAVKEFQFSIFNPSLEPLLITCRINDLKHTTGPQRYDDRFNQCYRLEQGWNMIKIDIDDIRDAPKTRRMDLKHIVGVGFFAMNLSYPQVIYIDDVRLVTL